MKNICIECKTNEARHWNSHLCESCFREILRNDPELEQAKKVNVESAENRWF